MREVVIDTETTGLDPHTGHRICEIACLELAHHVPTGRKFHRYVNPERDIPADALAVHGLTEEFLARHPLFADLADELLEFIGPDRLVIHNAEFDLASINAEMRGIGPAAAAGPAARCRGRGARRPSRNAGAVEGPAVACRGAGRSGGGLIGGGLAGGLVAAQ